MKKIFTVLVLLMLSLSSYAQSNVTKFLGIPVDGSKTKMEKQIEKKGFKKVTVMNKNLFMGEFNGREVLLKVSSNKDKTYRVMVMDFNSVDKNQIISRFNQLYNQFLNNPKYVLSGGEMIDEKEDISYQMIVKNKTYEAGFYQVGTFEEFHNILLTKYTEEQLKNPSKKLKKEIDKDIEEMLKKKIVWFEIKEVSGEYSIAIYYDNMYNFPNGEDL